MHAKSDNTLRVMAGNYDPAYGVIYEGNYGQDIIIIPENYYDEDDETLYDEKDDIVGNFIPLIECPGADELEIN